MTLDDISDFLRLDIESILEDVFLECRDDFLALQKAQMFSGTLNTGDPITPPYVAQTARRKGFSTPNLYNTGDFFQGIGVLVENRVVTVNSDVDYTKWIENRYGTDIWGLDQENMEKFVNETLLPALKNRIDSLGFEGLV